MYTGPGVLSIYQDTDVDGLSEPNLILEADAITGGYVLDPRKRGGLTPNIYWKMVEDIRHRDHPHYLVGLMTMARIIPLYEETQKEYEAPQNGRTFGLYGEGDWPFMIHQAGTSTGCIAILPKHWRDARNALNKAYHHSVANAYDFEIEVCNKGDL
ncbi:MAG: hypothetical protein KDB07_01840 [Planctomycetes bacterium]|nr:hypothetical protein [Planctomycetota bacterium]